MSSVFCDLQSVTSDFLADWRALASGQVRVQEARKDPEKPGLE